MAEILVEEFIDSETMVGDDGAVKVEVPFDEEAVKILEECGLSGQKEILESMQKRDDGSGSQNPYHLIKDSELRIWSEAFPFRTKVENYKGGVIPRRILGIIALLKQERMFGTLEIWSDHGTLADPILVGRNDNDISLIARWGTALAPFEDIVKKARNAYEKRIRALIDKESAKIEALKNTDISSLFESALRGDYDYIGGISTDISTH